MTSYHCPKCGTKLGVIIAGGAGLRAGNVVIPCGEIICYRCGWCKTWGKDEKRLKKWLESRYGLHTSIDTDSPDVI